MTGEISVNLSPTYEWKILYGDRFYEPKIIEPNTCGFSQTQVVSNNILGSRTTDSLFQPTHSELGLQFLIDESVKIQEQDIDKSRVNEEYLEIYPSHKAPIKLPMMYERDRLDETERQKWIPRIQMFEVAYKTVHIFSISIVPKNPKICQTWYQKRILKPSSEYLSPQSSSRQTGHKFSSTPQTEEATPKKQLGFLKPFETFSSENYGTDPIFEKIEAISIGSSEDIEESLKEIKKIELREPIAKIIDHFLKDEEAASVGIIFLNELNNQKSCVKLFRKSL